MSLRLPLLFILLGLTAASQAQSLFKDKAVYKLAIFGSGVYKIDSDFLKRLGINGDIRRVKMYSLPGGTLPQSNDSSFFIQPQELPLEFGEDYVLFYATGSHRTIIDTLKKTISQKVNSYSDVNYCFLILDEDESKTLKSHPKRDRSTIILQNFDTYIYFEEEKTNLLKSGRDWFSEPFRNGTQRRFEYTFTDAELKKPFNLDLRVLYSALT